MIQTTVNGLFTVLENIKVKYAIVSQQKEISENYKTFLQLAKKNKVSIIVVEAGDRINIERNVFIDILWPLKQQISQNALNNNSIVAKLKFNGFSILFTGDVEKIAEQQMVVNYENDMKADILKVAHHGSKTSTSKEWLNLVRPKIAIIGVGENNTFGHPSNIVINELAEIGSKIYRTDLNGEIIINVSNNGQMKVNTHLKQINKCLQSLMVGKASYTLSLKDAIEKSPELQQLMDDYDDINKVVSVAATIQGLPKNISTHAAGIIITKYDLVNFTPLDEGLDGIYQTQYEASDLEELGLLKMDFLGLTNLTNITKTVELIRKDNPSFVLPTEENDPQTYQMLARGDVSGVFQLESAGMRKVIMNLQTSTLEDIVQALALYRPGPMDIIPSFIKRKFNLEKITYPHQDLEDILKETYGMIVYQDQIMLIACKFAGYSLGRADILRRAVSKKKKSVLEEERKMFVESSIKQGFSNEVASNIYDYIVKFADYGFNKAHSVAYAKIAYLTAYLKCHYFSYYFSTLMTSFMFGSNLLDYTKELAAKNVKVNPPSINQSSDIFDVIKGEIYFPLSIIKGLGSVKVNELLEERKKGNFLSFEDFIIRTKNILASSLIENVIYSGALDEFGLTKKAMIESYQNIIAQSLYSFVKGVLSINYVDDEYNYGILKDKEIETIGLNIKYNFFKQCANLYIKYNMIKLAEIKENQKVKTMGVIEKVREIMTKQQEKMAFVEISDDTTKMEMVFFPKVYQQVMPLNKGMIIMVAGITQLRTTLQVVVEKIKKI